MKIDEKPDKHIYEEHSDEDTFDELKYSAFKENKINIFKSGAFGRAEIPFALMGIFILAMIILFVLFYPKTRKPADVIEIQSINEKLKKIEDRIAGIEAEIKQIDQISAWVEKADQLVYKHEKMNATESIRMKQLELNIDKQIREIKNAQLHNKQIKTKKQSVKVITSKTDKSIKKNSASVAKPPSKKHTKAQHHIVGAGDTLFSISRLYNMTIDELKVLNKSLAGNDIYPGQKLLIYQTKE